jgi:hypothetical protein
MYICVCVDVRCSFVITVYTADGFVSCMVFVRWGCLMSRYMERFPVDWPPPRLPRALLRLPLQRTTLFSPLVV